MSLERSYRRWLRAFPASHRARRENEMLGVLLANAAAEQRQATAGEAFDLVRHGARERAGLLCTDRITVVGLVSTLVFAAVGVGLLSQLLVLHGARASDAQFSPTLPTHLPWWQPMPAQLTRHPGGPVIAAYVTGNEDMDTFQMVLGADSATGRVGPWGTLSPDGRFFAVTSEGPDWVTGIGGPLPGGSALSTIDTATGRRRAVPGVRLLAPDAVVAWSRDSRLIAVRRDGHIATVDRVSGVTHDHGRGRSASFALNSDTLAIFDYGNVRFASLTGRVLHRWRVTGPTQMSRAGWSPDGRTIVLESTGEDEFENRTPGETWLLGVTDGRLKHLAVDGFSVGWRSDSEVLVAHENEWTGGAAWVGAQHLDSGNVRRLATLGSGDELGGLQLATALTVALDARDTGHLDRGPIHPRAWLLFLPVAAVAFLLSWGAAVLFAPVRPLRDWRWFVRQTIKHVVICVTLAAPLLFAAGIILMFTPIDAAFFLGATVAGSAATYIGTRSVVRSNRLIA